MTLSLSQSLSDFRYWNISNFVQLFIFKIKVARLASSSASPSFPSGTSSRIVQPLVFFPPNDVFCLGRYLLWNRIVWDISNDITNFKKAANPKLRIYCQNLNAPRLLLDRVAFEPTLFSEWHWAIISGLLLKFSDCQEITFQDLRFASLIHQHPSFVLDFATFNMI